MPDTVTAQIRNQVTVLRHVEDGWPEPRDITIRYQSGDSGVESFGASGTTGFDTGLNDTDEVFEDVVNLAGAAQVLDLTALTDPDGRAVAFAQVRYLRIVNRSTADAVTIAPDATDGWTDTPGVTLHPATDAIESRVEQTFPAATGGAVAAGNSRIRLDPGLATLDVAILVVGLAP